MPASRRADIADPATLLGLPSRVEAITERRGDAPTPIGRGIARSARALPRARTIGDWHWTLNSCRARQYRCSICSERPGLEISGRGTLAQEAFVPGRSSSRLERRRSLGDPVAQIDFVGLVEPARLDTVESDHVFEERGDIEVKGKGRLRAYLLVGRRAEGASAAASLG